MLADSSGYKVVCGGDSVGVIVNGVDGNCCTLADNGDGTVSQVCGKDTTILYKAFCGEKPYDPASYKCHENELFAFFVDARDSQEYRMVTIGEQTWMAENLNYAYTQKTAKLDSSSFCYDNDPANCEMYGRLYTWSAAMDSAAVLSEGGKDCGDGVTCSASGTVRGVCPEGWHLPDTTEWETLGTYIGSQASNGVGYALKSTSGWKSGNGSDAFGFDALPAGNRDNNGKFGNVLEYAYFWCSTGISARNAYNWYLYESYSDLYVSSYNKSRAFSVRCVKD